MVNRASTVLMTFFTGCSQADQKSERRGRSPNKVLVGGAKARCIWLVHHLNFCLHQCPILKVPFLDHPVVFIWDDPCVCVCAYMHMEQCELLSWLEIRKEKSVEAASSKHKTHLGANVSEIRLKLAEGISGWQQLVKDASFLTARSALWIQFLLSFRFLGGFFFNVN